METIRIRNWRKFQHYTNRRPDWIKLHSELLDSLEWRGLSDSLKGQLTAIWMLAARLHDATDTDAELPDDSQYISALTGCKVTDQTLQTLEANRFITRASDMLADCAQDASLEVRGEKSKKREEREKREGEFAHFWETYDYKVGKDAARKAWKKTNASRPENGSLLAAVEQYHRSENWRKGVRLHASTWLNQARWEDEVAESGPSLVEKIGRRMLAKGEA